MRTTTVTFRNDFHQTEVTLRVVVNDQDFARLSQAQANKAHRVLCGSKSCTCGDEIGRRGPQDETPFVIRLPQ